MTGGSFLVIPSNHGKCSRTLDAKSNLVRFLRRLEARSRFPRRLSSDPKLYWETTLYKDQKLPLIFPRFTNVLHCQSVIHIGQIGRRLPSRTFFETPTELLDLSTYHRPQTDHAFLAEERVQGLTALLVAFMICRSSHGKADIEIPGRLLFTPACRRRIDGI